MPFLSPNQQCRSTEGNWYVDNNSQASDSKVDYMSVLLVDWDSEEKRIVTFEASQTV